FALTHLRISSLRSLRLGRLLERFALGGRRPCCRGSRGRDRHAIKLNSRSSEPWALSVQMPSGAVILVIRPTTSDVPRAFSAAIRFSLGLLRLAKNIARRVEARPAGGDVAVARAGRLRRDPE